MIHWTFRVAIALVAVLSVAPPAWGDGGAADAAPEAASDAGVRDDVAALRRDAQRVRAFLEQKLALDVDPATLFDIELSDERAVAVERRRLEAVIAEGRADAGTDASAPAAPPPRRGFPRIVKKGEPPDGGADAAAEAAAPPIDPELWAARLELDRARLAFLSLPRQKRTALFDAHAKRQKGAEPKQKTTAAEKKAEAAAKARKKALEEVERATTEAMRLVAEERVRLLGVKEQQAKVEAELAKDEEQIAKRAEIALGWRRRVAQLVDDRKLGKQTAEEADTLYAELVKTVRAARAELDHALGAISSGDSGVPGAGPDRLDTAGALIDRSALDALRDEVETQGEKLRARERKTRWAKAKALLEQVESMNRDRLALYPHLTSARRSALTSISGAGIDQAKAEARQVSLVTRYHALATADFVTHFRERDRGGAKDVLATFTLLKILVLIGAFVGWRRRADDVVTSLHERAERALVESPTSPAAAWAERVVRFVGRVRRPLEWLVLLWGVLWLAGPTVSNLYEMRILWIVVSWTLGGMFVVLAIDAVFARRLRFSGQRSNEVLRLRSLRLMGRVIVAIGLSLALTTELVGQGTIYSWVLSFCWLAAVPVLWVLVRWWRPIIFERAEAQRRKPAVLEWVLAHRSGIASFMAALVGGVYLIGLGVARFARGKASTSTVYRRLLAYLFRREVAKQAKERQATEPLDLERYAKLSPDVGGDALLPTVGDEEIAAVLEAIDAPGGGVFAVVGERGSGKSRLLGRLLEDKPDSLVVECPPGGVVGFRAALCGALDLPSGCTDQEVIECLDARSDNNALFVDDAQRLIRPTIGGLDDFDRVIALARASSTTTTWVFCIGAVIWQYVARARGPRPIFDEVINIRTWSEEEIAELLSRRSRLANLEPVFRDLIAEEEDDELLFAEQLARTEASYYRLLWDYAGGNPAVALHFWRESLRVAPDGSVRVQLFQAPDTGDLERLPDPAVFVLRAVVQLELASFDDIVNSTMLPSRVVSDALRYAKFRGYIVDVDGRHQITWSWFRAITRFLERRHLLASRTKS